MALVINTNISSLQAQKNLSNTQANQATTFQRLSTGLRINSAKDDAGGLYLAEAQTKDIRGLNMATRNAGDGISMAQTAEGALDQIGKNLQRVNELAIQSANGSYNDAARGGLQKEVDELTQEINRIVETTEFNGQKLLSKDATQTDLQIGFKNDAGSSIKTGLEGGLAVQGDTRKFGVPGLEGISFHSKDQATLVAKDFLAKQLLGKDVNPANLYKSDTDHKYVATNLTSLGNAAVGTTAKDISNGLQQLGNGESFTVDGMTFSRQEQLFGDTAGQQLKIEFNGNETTVDGAWSASGAFTPAVTIDATNMTTLFGEATKSDLAPLANDYFGAAALTEAPAENTALKTDSLQVFKDGSLAALKGGESIKIDGITYARSGTDTTTTGASNLTISSDYGSTTITGAFASADGKAPTSMSETNMGGAALQAVFANADKAVQERGVMGDLLNGDLTATKSVDISSQASARNAIDFTRDSIDLVSELRATFGAVQNRFEAVISGNQTYGENLSAARSRVQDADFAQETANLAKLQVLQQAGTSILGQANASTQSVLGLL